MICCRPIKAGTFVLLRASFLLLFIICCFFFVLSFAPLASFPFVVFYKSENGKKWKLKIMEIKCCYCMALSYYYQTPTRDAAGEQKKICDNEPGQNKCKFHSNNFISSSPQTFFHPFFPIICLALLCLSCRMIIITLKYRRMEAFTDASFKRLISILVFFFRQFRIKMIAMNLCWVVVCCYHLSCPCFAPPPAKMPS